ncbi:MAG: phenylalanine--tRNA ligase subunit beta [Eubacteriales bacterium]|nr:phenylalanine--tRNA ligase subunit beta [Eubacteriales bacterium]
MKISLNWIRDFIDLDNIEINELAHRFTMAAAEIEEVIETGGEVSGVVVGFIRSVSPHPGSDKLKVCLVEAGGKEYLSVCGAPNVREGVKVPFALPGGSIRKNPEVRITQIAGIASSGIICSAAEIGMSDDHEGILILPDDYETGKNIKEYIPLDDVIIEIDNKSITNRPDLWGHFGIAREFAALFGKKLKAPELDESPEDKNLAGLDIEIRDKSKCLRYSGVCIKNAGGALTPYKMQVRLFYCGMRPIEPIVDLTNYIMLEIGQPMHAFDRKNIEKIIVDSTENEINFVTLDKTGRKIPADTLMINNQNEPVAIAGIMGGEKSGISPETDSIFLESATFEGASIRKGCSKIGLRTESSARYEKSLDPQLALQGIRRFIKLFREIKPDIVIGSKITDVYPVPAEPVRIRIERELIDKYVGQHLPSERIRHILESLEFKVRQDGDVFDVSVPSFRATKDITMKADLIEEITRIYGYDNIQPATVNVELRPVDHNRERETEHKIKEILAESFGFSEVNSYIWYDDDFNKKAGITHDAKLRIANPHAKNMSILRDSMFPSLMQMAEGNARYFDDFGIFEIGSVFNLGKNKETLQHKNLCILAASKAEKEDALFYRLKGIFAHILKTVKKKDAEFVKADIGDYSWLHPVKSVTIKTDGEKLGYISVTHPSVGDPADKKLKTAVLEIRMDVFNDISEKQITYAEPSKFQRVNLDFSFLADSSISYEQFKKDALAFESDIVKEFSFVGIYTGKGLPEGKKSITVNYRIGSDERTLTGEEIEEFTAALLCFMEGRGYPLR